MVIHANKKARCSSIPEQANLSFKRMYIAHYIGVVPYERGLKKQQALIQAIAGGRIPNVLLLLQHSPVSQ